MTEHSTASDNSAYLYCGIGIGLEKRRDGSGFTISLIDSLNPTPAQRHKLKNGDTLLEINTNNGWVQPLNPSTAHDLIRGTQGSHVTLKIQRQTSTAPETITLQRDAILEPHKLFDHRLSATKIVLTPSHRCGELVETPSLPRRALAQLR